MDRFPARTLLEQLIRQSRRTIEESCAAFERTAATHGENATLSPRNLSRWMAGKAGTARPVAQRVAALHWRLPFEVLVGPPLSEDSVGVEAKPPVMPAASNGRGRTSVWEAEDVGRRTLLRAFATAGTTAALAPASIETLRHQLVAAIGGDPADIADWEAVAWEYGWTYATTPAPVLLEDLSSDLFIARERLQSFHDEHMRAGMRRVIAQLAVFIAHTLANLGNFRASHRWWRVAQASASGSADNEIALWVAGRQIIGGLYERRPLNALLTLADEAAATCAAPGIGTGSVLIGRAQILAVIGNESEARRAMAQVYAILDRLPERVRANADSLYGWPEYRLRHGESFVYSYLGDTKRAEAAQQRALKLYPQHMLRERAQIQLHQAMCMTRHGDAVGGAVHAGQVLSALPDTQKTEVVLEIARSVVRAVPARDRGRSEVAELHELLALTSTAGE